MARALKTADRPHVLIVGAGLPAASPRVPARAVIEAREGGEHWTRFFGGKPMRSVMTQGPKEGIVRESFGAFRCGMRGIPSTWR